MNIEISKIIPYGKNAKKHTKKQEDGGSTVWRFGREFNYKHPTQKPVQMIMKGVLNSSKAGEVVAKANEEGEVVE